MTGQYPGSPKLFKGALAVYGSQDAGTEPSILPFQYNPESVKRTLAARAAPAEQGSTGGSREESTRVAGPPVETISLGIVLDATDPLESPDENESVAENGLHPALAVLEMLLYPPGARFREHEQLAEQGEVQLEPEDLPLVLLIWGASRVVPVRITGFSVSEEAFDANLNPIRARVELSLQVLTYMELEAETIGRDAYVAYQSRKEEFAADQQETADPETYRGLLPQ